VIEKMEKNCKEFPDKLAFSLFSSVRNIGSTPNRNRVLAKSHIPESGWGKAGYEEIVMVDDRGLRAFHNVQLYQSRISRAFNKKVRPRDLQEGDMVLKEISPTIQDPSGKF